MLAIINVVFQFKCIKYAQERINTNIYTVSYKLRKFNLISKFKMEVLLL